MIGLTLLLVASAFGFALSRRFALPVIPLLLLLGALLHLAGVAPEQREIRGVLELGLTFLVFAAGIELNPQRFGAQRRVVAWVAPVQLVAAGLLGFLVARLLHYDVTASLYIGFALSASSTLVVLRHLRQHQQLFEPFGRVVIGTLLVQDFLMILIIVVLSRINRGPMGIALGLAGALAMSLLALGLQRTVMPRAVLQWKLREEELLLGVLALLFAFVGLSSLMGLPPITGGFLAGFALSAFPVSGAVRGLLTPLSDFFLALFFAALGALTTIPSGTNLVHALLLSAFVILSTPPLVAVIGEWKGMTARASVESGLLLAQSSEFSLITGLTGLFLAHITQETFSMLALVTVITMTLTPFLATDSVTRVLLRWHPLRLRQVEPGSGEGHVLLLGFGAGGMWVLKPFLAQGDRVVIVDDDPAVVAELSRQGIPCIRGDASDEQTLKRAGARNARLIIAALRRAQDARKVIRYARGVPVVVRVFSAIEAEKVRRAGGIPVLNSMAAADTFMDWYDKNHARAGGGAANPMTPA